MITAPQSQNTRPVMEHKHINQVKETKHKTPNDMLIQDRIWNSLAKAPASTKLPPIASRYIARELQMKGVTKIVEVVKTMKSVFTITGDNGKMYHIGLNPIDIPAASIKESKL